MMDYKDKINIDYNDGTKLKENEIAFAIYCNVSDADITAFCNYIYYILSLGKWISKNKEISMYIVNSNFDILGLENKNAYNKVIYIKCEEINNENISANNFRKMYDHKENSKTIPSTEYSFSNIDNIIYGCYERKLDKAAELYPYCSDVEDNKNLLRDDIFIRVEEIFAKENYKKNLVNWYRLLLSRNGISADAGFSYNVIMNNAIDNDDITNIINEKFKTNLNGSSLIDYDIRNHIDAVKEIFKSIYADKLTDKLLNELNKYLSEIENKLGNYIKLYSIYEDENENDTNVNPFYINLGTWCVVYQNAILIISYGSDE